MRGEKNLLSVPGNSSAWLPPWYYLLLLLSTVLNPGEGNGNPLQYSCLENPTDRGTWGAAVHGVAQSQTRLKWRSARTHAHRQYWIQELLAQGSYTMLPSRQGRVDWKCPTPPHLHQHLDHPQTPSGSALCHPSIPKKLGSSEKDMKSWWLKSGPR